LQVTYRLTGPENICSRGYEAIPIFAIGHQREDDCMAFGFNQTIAGSETLQFVFVEFRDCDAPENVYNNRCDKHSNVEPYETLGQKTAKCVDGLATVYVYVQDNQIFDSNHDMVPIPSTCKPGESKFSRCQWKFQISCSC